MEGTYRVYLRSIRTGWSIGVRYIYLISMFSTYTVDMVYVIIHSQHVYVTLFHIHNSCRNVCGFCLQLTLACGLRFN
jgi:hypothetical protein